MVQSLYKIFGGHAYPQTALDAFNLTLYIMVWRILVLLGVVILGLICIHGGTQKKLYVIRISLDYFQFSVSHLNHITFGHSLLL